MRVYPMCLLVLVLFGLVACATSPTGRSQLKLIPSGTMDSMGFDAFEQIKQDTKISKDKKLNAYVQCVANAVIRAKGDRPKEWEVVVFDSDQLNAFALPGNKIGVFTGLLKAASNQDRLAAVLGHEVAHVIAEHGNERMSAGAAANMGMQVMQQVMSQGDGQQYQQLMGLLGLGVQYGVILPYGRAHESEADIIGLELMAKAGFKPEESIELWQQMAKLGGGATPEFLSTHPSHKTRINDLRAHMEKAKAVAGNVRPKCG